MAFLLTHDQRTAVEQSGGPLLVSAAAGAGKTRVLVERLIDRVVKGANINEFLVITFTNAAAAELRGRVSAELGERLAQTPGDRHLRRQLTLVYDAQISTVHAFCGQVLREWGHLLDIDPDYRLLDEGEEQLLKGEALESLLEERYERAEEDPALGLLLDTFSAGGRDDKALGKMVLEMYDKLQSHPDPRGWTKRVREIFAQTEAEDLSQTLWGEYLLEKARSRGKYWWEKLSAIYKRCKTGVAAYCPSLAVTLDDLWALAKVKTWDEAREVTFPRLGSSAKCKDPETAERAKALRARCGDEMEKLWGMLSKKSGPLLRDLRDVAPAVDALMTMTEDLSDRYDEVKGKRGVLDFNDLEHKALALLDGFPQAAEAIRGRFREVMVDEYQDTNRVQNAIFERLTEGMGNLFMVGDVKQSIYRFRMADPTLFLEKYQTYPPCDRAAPGEGRRVTLGENFRSRREVIDGVNFLFENLMSRELGEMDYGPEEALRPMGTFPEDEADRRVELFVIQDAQGGEDGDKTMTEARFVARRLARLVREGFPVSDGKRGTRPVRPSDMAILMRAPGSAIGRYARALREVGLPWESGGGEDFFDEPETAAALSFLEIIDNPRQDVPLIAVLRSPVYGFTPDRLAALRREKGDGDFYDALRRDEGEDAKAFLKELDELRFLAADLGSGELIWELYRRTGLLDIYAAMEGGEARREHLLALYQYARQFEGTGHKGLFGFLHHLRRRREQGEGLVLPGGGAGEGVHILSIHKSKGQEFPVVVVAGLAKGINWQDSYAPMLFHGELGIGPKGVDMERRVQYPTAARWAVAEKLKEETCSEELRLLYVALTRAKEKLIMTMTMKNADRELGRLLEDAGLPPDPRALAGQTAVGQWVLSAALCRPEGSALRRGRVLRNRADHDFGTPWRIELVDGSEITAPARLPGVAAEEGTVLRGDIPDYSWTYPWAAAVSAPSKLTATQLKGRSLDAEAAEDTAAAPRPILFDRPHFALEAKGLTPGERGTAHHLVMQFLDFGRTGSVREVEEEIARLVEQKIITEQQGEAVDPAVIFAFFQSPLGREALASGTLRREFKFSVLEEADRYDPRLPLGETVLLQGVVDCWYETPDGLVVIDFKSDRVTGETAQARAEEYKPQLDAYSRALGLMTGKPVIRRALWFFSLGRAVEV